MSDAMGVAKPDPAFFARTLELIGSPPPADVAYVGDRVDNDVRPSAAAGMRAVWIRRGPWGLLHTDRDGPRTWWSARSTSSWNASMRPGPLTLYDEWAALGGGPLGDRVRSAAGLRHDVDAVERRRRGSRPARRLARYASKASVSTAPPRRLVPSTRTVNPSPPSARKAVDGDAVGRAGVERHAVERDATLDRPRRPWHSRRAPAVGLRPRCSGSPADGSSTLKKNAVQRGELTPQNCCSSSRSICAR